MSNLILPEHVARAIKAKKVEESTEGSEEKSDAIDISSAYVPEATLSGFVGQVRVRWSDLWLTRPTSDPRSLVWAGRM